MSAYEELHNRATDAWCAAPTIEDGITAVLDEVFRSLGTVTPEMDEAYWRIRPFAQRADAAVDWLAMLHASPLEPPK